MNASVLTDPTVTPGANANGGADPKSAADSRITELRTRIDEIDDMLINLWLERASISHEVGATRVAAGGTRLVLAREELLVRLAVLPPEVRLRLLELLPVCLTTAPMISKLFFGSSLIIWKASK